MLAGTLIAIPFWFVALAGDWLPHKIVPIAVIALGVFGIMWLYDELTDHPSTGGAL